MTTTVEAPAKRRPGRPRKNPLPVAQPEPVETISEEAEEVFSPAEEADEEYPDSLLDYDLGCAGARKASKTPLARRHELSFGVTYLPDLSGPGTIVNKHEPTWEFQRGWVEEDGSRFARQIALTMKQRGWRPAMADDFMVRPDLRDSIVPDDSGRLVFADMGGKVAAFVVVRDKKDMERIDKENLRHSDEINMTAEEKAAQVQESLRSAGMRGVVAKTEFTDE